MKIRSQDINAGDFLQGKKFLIPRFQRPYSWQKSDVRDFLDDIFSSENTDYFIGSMVLYKSQDRNAVVDGQQRLSTIIITLAAIRDHFLKQKLPDLANGIQFLIERPNKENVKEFTLSPETSYPYFQDHVMLMSGGDPNAKPDDGDEEGRIYSAYKIAQKFIGDSIKSIKVDPRIKDEEKNTTIKKRLEDFRDQLLSVNIVTITLDNEEDAYTVFETLNTRGRDLSVTDLIKNHVTRGWTVENADLDKASDSWKVIIAVLEESDIDIKSDEFFTHQWASMHEYTSKPTLFTKFRKKINPANVQTYLSNTELDAKIYRLIKEPTYSDSDVAIPVQDEQILKSLEALRIFNVKMPTPTLLSILRGYFLKTIKPNQASKALKAIENYHFINSAITSQRSSGSTQRMYSDWAIELENAQGDKTVNADIISKYIEKLKDDLAPLDEFLLYFSEKKLSKGATKDKKLIRYLLYKIHENYCNGQPIDYSKMTVEHILSQEQKNELTDSNLVGNIGNLIFVHTSLNSEKLQNKNFQDKLKVFKDSEDPGLSNDPITSFTEWADEEIKQRARDLAELGYNSVWKL